MSMPRNCPIATRLEITTKIIKTKNFEISFSISASVFSYQDCKYRVIDQQTKNWAFNQILKKPGRFIIYLLENRVHN